LKVPLPIGTFALSVREFRAQVVVPVLPRLVAGAVALFAVLSVVVLTELVVDLDRLEDDVPQERDAREATLYTGAGG
jgi:hypothetical protein